MDLNWNEEFDEDNKDSDGNNDGNLSETSNNDINTDADDDELLIENRVRKPSQNELMQRVLKQKNLDGNNSNNIDNDIKRDDVM
eukprot:CAMPEP_0114690346 /NCGR_PEP_ID=MMETSP0191-20121206/65606_1 /TAXON_ID=126664 /ORGANISM="Sorites sp." /LENGTH=83 /DNA_ID=CAMNT_0001980177 /DNA_START=26 /DNA_END=277 /DNA_ORIENTATION=-